MAFKCLSCNHIPFMLYVNPALNSKINITQFLLSSQNSILLGPESKSIDVSIHSREITAWVYCL